MEKSIQARWAENPGFKDLNVSADAAKNEATVSGTVPTETLRSEAVDLAKAASPGLVVTDKIDVKPAEVSLSQYTEDMAREAREKAKTAGDKIGNSLEDAWIHTKITAKLIGDRGASARKINVDVMDQVVVLRGRVGSAGDKIEAERIARETDGVKRVVNQLKVALS
jgi:osmotically-inducible protein OsmY